MPLHGHPMAPCAAVMAAGRDPRPSLCSMGKLRHGGVPPSALGTAASLALLWLAQTMVPHSN